MVIYGKNAVIEAIKSKAAFKVYVSSNNRLDGKVLSFCSNNGITVKNVDNSFIDRLVKNTNHQGIACEVEEFRYTPLDKLIKAAKAKEHPLLLILDGIEDPQNLGAIIRTVDAFSADGIIIKNNNQVQVNSTVYKTSTGAIHHVAISQVSNLNNAINTLKQNGFWIVSADGEGNQLYTDIDYKFPTALIIGSEGFGISHLLLKNSDYVVKIPMTGHVNSLNASVATAIFISNIIYKRTL